MKFQYTKYKEMATNIIKHIERDGKKFPSFYDLEGQYCDEGIQYHNYACDYAYRKWTRHDRHTYGSHMCFYCPLRFPGYVYCHDTLNYLRWAYERDEKDLCIELIKKLSNDAQIRKGVLVK